MKINRLIKVINIMIGSLVFAGTLHSAAPKSCPSFDRSNLSFMLKNLMINKNENDWIFSPSFEFADHHYYSEDSKKITILKNNVDKALEYLTEYTPGTSFSPYKIRGKPGFESPREVKKGVFRKKDYYCGYLILNKDSQTNEGVEITIGTKD